MRTIFIDESKARDFILCSVTITEQKIALSRSAVRKLVMPGQRFVHFVSESRRRKLQILKRLREIDFDVKFLVVRTGSPAERREVAIKALVEGLHSEGYCQLIFDEDVTYTVSDRLIVRTELESLGVIEKVSYSHVPSRHEPLLWIPDAMAWTFAKGGHWARELGKFKTKIISLG